MNLLNVRVRAEGAALAACHPPPKSKPPPTTQENHSKKKGKPTKSEVFHKTYIQKYLTNCDYNMYNLSFNILTTLLLVVTYFRFFFSSNKINDV